MLVCFFQLKAKNWFLSCAKLLEKSLNALQSMHECYAKEIFYLGLKYDLKMTLF